MTTDRRQLMQNLLNGESVDRVPVGFWWHYYSVPRPIAWVQAQMKGPSKVPPEVIWRILPNNPFRGYLNEPFVLASLDGHKRDYRALAPDFVKIMSDGYFSHPSILDSKVATAADLSKIAPRQRSNPERALWEQSHRARPWGKSGRSDPPSYRR